MLRHGSAQFHAMGVDTLSETVVFPDILVSIPWTNLLPKRSSVSAPLTSWSYFVNIVAGP